jgi:tetratricopeptide (TPR) repeat protein
MQSLRTVALRTLLVSAQAFAQSPYGIERLDTPITTAGAPRPEQKPSATVSAEVLRHPIGEKVRDGIRKALRFADAGNHKAAIAHLKLLRARRPAEEGYVKNVLGVEYLRLEQYAEAQQCFERAVALLPLDATNHADLALTFIGMNRLDRAQPELERALELDPLLTVTRQLLNALLASNRMRTAAE